jgi:hypothetical protein
VVDVKVATNPDFFTPVRAACHASVTFDTDAREGSELVIEHLSDGKLLARECRPLTVGSRSVDFKTHPDASHVVCSIKANDQTIDGVRFDVQCGKEVDAIGRYFIVIGAMKSGTTSLYHMLAQHPAMCKSYAELPGASFTKEINYFNRLFRKGHTNVHYDWRFPFDASRHAWTLDVSPNYAKLPRTRPVPRRIAMLEGEVRLAYILRDPIDRIESNLAHKLRKQGKVPKLDVPIRISQYARHLDRFTEHIPLDDILLLDFRELQRDPSAIQAKICDFLGIDRFIANAEIHNRRGVDFHLDEQQRNELADALRADVRILINRYGFEPAKEWLKKMS